MEVGYCSNLNFLLGDDEKSREIFNGILDAGYDYFETQLSNLLLLSEKQQTWFFNQLNQAKVPMKVNLLLFPNDMILVGPGLDIIKVTDHAKRALSFAKAHGSDLVVFGNGGSRRVPEGLEHYEVLKQMEEILKAVAPIAAENKIMIGLEPLCKGETNMINTFAQGAQLTQKIDSPWVKNVCDWYHVAVDGADVSEMVTYKEELGHLHIANPKGRFVPSTKDDPQIYAPFMSAIKQTGYRKRISIEAGIPEGENIAECIADGLKAVKSLVKEL